MLSLLAIIVIITKASVSSLESSCFSTYSGAPQGHHVIFPAKGPPCPLPHIYHCYISYINISLLHPRWDEQCRDTMMTVPPQLTSSLPSFSYPASFRHPPPASSVRQNTVQGNPGHSLNCLKRNISAHTLPQHAPMRCWKETMPRCAQLETRWD